LFQAVFTWKQFLKWNLAVVLVLKP